MNLIMGSDCLFCRIINKEIPADIVYEDDDMLVFKDIDPQADVHLLAVPKKHIPTLNDVSSEDDRMLGAIIRKLGDLARQAGIAEGGYRLVVNCNRNAGQEVFHLHYHLLGGRKFSWPPG